MGLDDFPDDKQTQPDTAYLIVGLGAAGHRLEHIDVPQA